MTSALVTHLTLNKWRFPLRRSALALCAIALTIAAPTSTVSAQDTTAAAQQGAPKVRSLAFIADSIAFTGDTARAVAMLDSAVRADKRDAASWHQLGLILWNQAKSQRSGGNIRDIRIVRMLSAADSSLRMATQLEPDSARYWLSLNQFSASSGLGSTIMASGRQASNALEAAEKAGDRLAVAQAADAAGMAAWRRYEPVAKRALASDGRQVDLGAFSNVRRDHAVDYLSTFVKRIEPPTGTADYSRALENFRRALDADPTNSRIARHYFMALGEREQWQEMRAVAMQRSAEFPLDWQARLARGLAEHRLGNGMAAQVAFDSALIYMDEKERDRMTSLARVLRPGNRNNDTSSRRVATSGVNDVNAYNRLSQEQQGAITALYWLMADPLAITPENEHRNEFLARVTWADFRWTTEEQNLRGADTDRGDVFIRYGPPKLDMVISGNSSNTPGAGNTLAWVYEGQSVFFFDMMPGFLSARTAFYDKDYVDQVKDAVPVSWANVPATRSLDTIPILTSRFRATRDSMDVVVAASIPVDSMVRGLEMNKADVNVDIRIFDRFVQVRGAESANTVVEPDTVRRPINRSWVKRVGPGMNLLRVEALQPDSKRAARALTRLDSDMGLGFGISDIMLGSSPSPRGSAAPSSWRDIQITPGTGNFTSPQIGMVWEVYELGIREGQSKYRIEIAVERVSKGLGGFTARIVDNLGRTLGREQSGVNRLSTAFDRTAAASSKQVEYITLNLGNANAGEYKLTVTVLDQSNSRRVSRTTSFFLN